MKRLPTKWSNTLKQFVGRLLFLSVFDHFVGLLPRGLKSYDWFVRPSQSQENVVWNLKLKILPYKIKGFLKKWFLFLTPGSCQTVKAKVSSITFWRLRRSLHQASWYFCVCVLGGSVFHGRWLEIILSSQPLFRRCGM